MTLLPPASKLLRQLPSLSSHVAVPAAQVAEFKRNGHIVLQGVASREELAEYRPHIMEAAMRHCPESAPLEQRDTYGKAFLQIMNLWCSEPAVARFVLSQRFASVAAALLGVERVRVYHDQALLKEANGGFTPWHQDALYWPLDGNSMITMWMPLHDLTPDMGGLVFASKSHVNGPVSSKHISDESEEEIAAAVQAYELGDAATCMSAGDASFHLGWTAHRAPGNVSSSTREVMTIIWFADGLCVNTPANSNQVRDLKDWLPGCSPGDTAASPLNPLLP